MYRINDRSAAIKHIQIMLSHIDGFRVYPSGVFDESTGLAVSKLQRENRIAETGEVDIDTFNLIRKLSSEQTLTKDIRSNRAAYIDFPILPGDCFREMNNINAVLAAVMDYYGHTHRINIGNYFSDEAAAAVRILRVIYLLDEGTVIDEIFYERLMRDHESICLFNKMHSY